MNAILNNTLIQQPRSIHNDTEYLVVFRGGQGGNFLSTVLNSSLGYQSDNTNIGSNEYHSTKGPVQNSHINLWFRQDEYQKYMTETYSVGAYRGILQLFKERNIKLIVLNAEYPFMLYTELIGSIKAIKNNTHNDKDTLDQINTFFPYNILHNQEPKYKSQKLKQVAFYQGIVRHYHTLSRLATAYDIPHISCDYRDIFLDLKLDTLVEFMDIPTENIAVLKNSIADYTELNNSLLKDFGLEFPA